MKLSILICSLAERHWYLSSLLSMLGPQIVPETELLINIDSRTKTIGEKRNELLHAANGEHVVFVDDDDVVPSDYVASILDALKHDPDCIGFWGMYHASTGKATPVHYSHQNPIKTFEGELVFKGDVYERAIQQVNPVRRKLALAAKFMHINELEDAKQSEALKPLLKTEVFIDKTMYHHWPQGSRVL